MRVIQLGTKNAFITAQLIRLRKLHPEVKLFQPKQTTIKKQGGKE